MGWNNMLKILTAERGRAKALSNSHFIYLLNWIKYELCLLHTESWTVLMIQMKTWRASSLPSQMFPSMKRIQTIKRKQVRWYHTDVKQAAVIDSSGGDHFRKHWKGMFEEMTFDMSCEWRMYPWHINTQSKAF